MREKTEKVFVYGTLKQYARPDDSWIHGTLYNMGPFPGIKLSDTGNVIRGQILEVSTDALAELDRYEGVPRLFRRVRTVVGNEKNDELEEVWVYEWAGSVSNLKVIKEWPVRKASRR